MQDISERQRERNAPSSDEGLSAFLYDADGEDRDIELDDVSIDELDEDDLLWIDADSLRDDSLEHAASAVSLDLETLRALPQDQPFIRDVGEAFILGVLPSPGDEEVEAGSDMLVCAVGHNWFLSLHAGGVASLEHFSEHLRGDSALGRLDAPSFLAQALEWVLNGYFDRLDELQRTIDGIEEALLRDLPGGDTVGQLVTMRRDLGELRRRLSPHRQVFITLAHPSFDVISGSDAAAEFAVLADRLETALQTIDSTREMIFGSFDVIMSRTAQRTNDIMRVLTLVSVVLLPATVIAGIFGMNMLPKYLLQGWVFWGVLGLMLLVAAGLLLTVRAFFWRR